VIFKNLNSVVCKNMATMAASESSFSSETESSSKGGSGKSQVSGKRFEF